MYDASLYTLIGIPNLSNAFAVNAHFATFSQMTEILTWFSFICSWLSMAHQPVDNEVMQEVPFQISRVALRLPCSTLFITPDGAKHRSTEVWSHWFQRHCAVPALF